MPDLNPRTTLIASGTIRGLLELTDLIRAGPLYLFPEPDHIGFDVERDVAERTAADCQQTRTELIHPFTGLHPAQFHRLVRLVARRGGDAIADGRPGRSWALTLPERVLLMAVYWRTNQTMRQIGPPFGVSHSAAHRLIDTLGPLLALAPARRRPTG